MIFFATPDQDHLRRERRKAQEMRQSLWWRQQIGRGTCYHCEQKFPREQLTMDHLIPLARGGMTTKKNCVVSCKTCNSKKGHQLPVEAAFAELEKQSEAIGLRANENLDEQIDPRSSTTN